MTSCVNLYVNLYVMLYAHSSYNFIPHYLKSYHFRALFRSTVHKGEHNPPSNARCELLLLHENLIRPCGGFHRLYFVWILRWREVLSQLIADNEGA